ncbi:uncharacterized protein TNCT_711171 [Trichonephila clavata]|uniref:Uncharacterized protein n=1 Tax=Trichonephila clavata TaxID=2740835 RepID=A0A8X6HYI9_TRICU|nr:uncharacterized protein TNCT_711171 [Trichonephila clavata]
MKIQSFKVNSTKVDPELLLRTYVSIKSTISGIDNKLSFLMFMTTVFSFVSMYESVSVIVQPFKYPNLVHRIFNWFGFLATFGSFAAMSISASLVCEASQEIGDMAEASFENSQSSRCMQLRFLMSAEKEISLTAWKMMPIRRNFILATTGALFTYVIMFTSLEAKS